jgi:hypothetical protein
VVDGVVGDLVVVSIVNADTTTAWDTDPANPAALPEKLARGAGV